MRKFKMGIRRLGASLSAFLMVCCFTVSALASGHDWPASPSYQDFVAHHGSWYVWQQFSSYGEPGFELICHPLVENQDTNTSYFAFVPYSTDSLTYSYTDSGTTTTLLAAIPYIPFGASGYWSELPSFPVGSGNSYSHCAYVRVYPFVSSGALSSIPDIFSDSWPLLSILSVLHTNISIGSSRFISSSQVLTHFS